MENFKFKVAASRALSAQQPIKGLSLGGTAPSKDVEEEKIPLLDHIEAEVLSALVPIAALFADSVPDPFNEADAGKQLRVGSHVFYNRPENRSIVVVEGVIQLMESSKDVQGNVIWSFTVVSQEPHLVRKNITISDIVFLSKPLFPFLYESNRPTGKRGYSQLQQQQPQVLSVVASPDCTTADLSNTLQFIISKITNMQIKLFYKDTTWRDNETAIDHNRMQLLRKDQLVLAQQLAWLLAVTCNHHKMNRKADIVYQIEDQLRHLREMVCDRTSALKRYFNICRYWDENNTDSSLLRGPFIGSVTQNGDKLTVLSGTITNLAINSSIELTESNKKDDIIRSIKILSKESGGVYKVDCNQTIESPVQFFVKRPDIVTFFNNSSESQRLAKLVQFDTLAFRFVKADRRERARKAALGGEQVDRDDLLDELYQPMNDDEIDALMKLMRHTHLLKITPYDYYCLPLPGPDHAEHKTFYPRFYSNPEWQTFALWLQTLLPAHELRDLTTSVLLPDQQTATNEGGGGGAASRRPKPRSSSKFHKENLD